MSQILPSTIENIKKTIPLLTGEQIKEIDKELHKYIETFILMGVAETAFTEWLDQEEDIYKENI